MNNEKIREALEFYAEGSNYFGVAFKGLEQGTVFFYPMNMDGGKKARAALEELAK